MRSHGDQLLANQLISQEAIRQERLVRQVLDQGLTGGNFDDGSIVVTKIAPALTVGPSGSSVVLVPPRIGPIPAFPAPSASARQRIRLSVDQLLVNQRIAQVAVRRVNALSARLERGLTAADVTPGSISIVDLAPELR